MNANEHRIYTQAIIDRAKNHDNEAIATLYKETYGMVYGTVRMMISDEQTVEDLVQDAFLKGFQSLDQLADPKSYPAWMRRIATNRVKDYFKKRKPVVFSQMEDEKGAIPEFEDERMDDLPEVVIDRKETTRLLDEILNTLPNEQRMAIVMFYYQQMSVREIAKMLGDSEGTVKSRLNYGRKKIEMQVRVLEKHGTKLYGLAPIPFLLILFRSFRAEISSMTVPELSVMEMIHKCAETVSDMAGAANTGASGVTSVGENIIYSVSEFIKQHILFVIICPIIAISAVVLVLPLLQSDLPSMQPAPSAEEFIDPSSQEQSAEEESAPAVPMDGNKTIYRIVRENIDFRFGDKMTVEYEYHPDGYRLSASYSAINDGGSVAKWKTIYHYDSNNPFLPSELQLYDSGGSLKFTYAYEYDSQNRLIKQTRYNGDVGAETDYVYTCSYNENGQKEYVRLETRYGNWAERTYFYDGDHIIGYEHEYMPAYYDPNYPDSSDHSHYTVDFVYDNATDTLSDGSRTYCMPTTSSGGHYREIFENEQFDDAGNVVSYDEHVIDDEFLHREIEYAVFEVPESAFLFNDLPTRYSFYGNAEFELITDGNDTLLPSFSFWISDMSLDDFYFGISRSEG